MYATIQKWGNSNGLRIPKAFLDTLGLRENDRVELIQTEDAITIKKAAAVPHKTLEERLTEFYGKPIQEIGPLQAEEVDWGKAEGREVW
ncbi:MAG: AbrB/MazE/SpoVT family DNA-binding domain-containing protein [Lawsonibacter sp.]|nr:AbrB/MazE/SpoVT family DNA-binding domain-containing protein [Lawsonibacter sp.]